MSPGIDPGAPERLYNYLVERRFLMCIGALPATASAGGSAPASGGRESAAPFRLVGEVLTGAGAQVARVFWRRPLFISVGPGAAKVKRCL